MLIKVIGYSVLVALILFIGLVIWQTTAYNAEQPDYKVISSTGKIEIRQYPPMILAKITTIGRRYPAIQNGFKSLASYIFGENKSKQKVNMTAPVMQQQNLNTTEADAQKEDWIVSFIMPKNYSLKTLPLPSNPDIQIETIPERKFIVIQFSGLSTDAQIAQKNKELLEYVKKNKLQTRGPAIMAFYNPPWILPFLRRNEIMYELK